MGVAQKTRRCLIKKEVGILFFIPAILPMIMMIFLIAGANKVFGEAILQENLFLTYGIVTLTVFSGGVLIMKRKYEVIGIVIDTEKEAEKCSFLSAVLDCKIENFAKITDFFWGGEIER